MRKHRKLLITLAFLAVIGGVAVFATRDNEPNYDGHPLSYWARQYDGASEKRFEAFVAISKIGTNALPCFLDWMEYKPSAFRTWVTRCRSETGRGWKWIPIWATMRPQESRKAEAAIAFQVLGASATSAIPRLAKLARTPGDSWGHVALANIGPNAIPALLQVLGDTNLPSNQRFSATRSLGGLLYGAASRGRLGTNAGQLLPVLLTNLGDSNELVSAEAADVISIIMDTTRKFEKQSSIAQLHLEASIPTLIEALRHPEARTRGSAASALASFRAQSIQALPALLLALQDPDIDVRQRATNALLQLAPELLTNTPAK